MLEFSGSEEIGEDEEKRFSLVHAFQLGELGEQGKDSEE